MAETIHLHDPRHPTFKKRQADAAKAAADKVAADKPAAEKNSETKKP